MIDWTEYTRIAESVAKKVASEYPFTDAEDIRQEILLHVAEKAATYEAKDYPGGQVRNNFRKVAVAYAGRERARFLHHSAQYVYTSPEVRLLFEKAFFSPELWEKPPTKDDGNSVTAGGIVVALWDLDRAYGALAPADAEVIARRYDREETLNASDLMRLSRAIDKVTRTLNNGVMKRDQAAAHWSGPGPRRYVAGAE
ncbi:hypothetical protein ACFUT3_30425 [Streptomyces cinereoruber]|uniref:hypothetical protein n=1 Tax=Streptomyces cinereoruber TaxID=67260 RepID=UPI00362CDEF9